MEELFISGPFLNKSLVSLIFLSALVVFRMLFGHWVAHKAKFPVEQRRRWLVQSRNTLIFIALAGLAFIWLNEIRTLAVSLLAIAVAFVVATKELILCFSGAVLRRTSDAYDLGDRIELSGMRGEVIDISYFGVSLREIGPGKTGQQYTGKSIHIPHSILLSNPVVNESFTGAFQLHLFSVPWRIENDWRRAETLLLQAAREETSSIAEKARDHLKTLEDRKGIETPFVEPRVTLEMAEPDQIIFRVRVPVSSGRISRIEQSILRRFLDSFYSGSQTEGATS